LRHGLPERYFLFVGTNDPRKNLGCIPPAIAAAGLDAELAVAGWSGWGRAGGKGMRVLGYVGDDELACLYSGALALVFVSSYEGFGLPVLEAMACGCPVVCSRAASLPEVAGGAALYVDDPTDTAGLAAALGRVAGDPGYRDELAAAGRERAARFSWERTARASLDTFRHALGRS
jgi:alpha-1,3-rhamnosyl/mannosyltransferase